MENKKCRICNNLVNFYVLGMPEDLCWGCLEESQQNEVLDKNIGIQQTEDDFDITLNDGLEEEDEVGWNQYGDDEWGETFI